MTSQGNHMTAPALKTFTFVPGLDLRSIDREESPWFVARDALNALGLVATTTSLDGIEAEDKVRESLGMRGLAPWLVSEAGLYSLVFGSQQDNAKDFQRWVTKAVLPSFREKRRSRRLPQVTLWRAMNSPVRFSSLSPNVSSVDIAARLDAASNPSAEAIHCDRRSSSSG